MNDHRLSWGRLAASFGIIVLAGCASSPASRNAIDVVGQRKIIALAPNERIGSEVRTAADAGGYRWLAATRLSALDLHMPSFEMPPGIAGAQAIAALEGAAPGAIVGINHAYRVQQGAKTVAALDYADTMMGWPRGGCPAHARSG